MRRLSFHHHAHPGPFVRTKLRRRIFAWFLGGIVGTGFLVFAAMTLLAHLQEPEWARTWQRSREWIGKQFAHQWHDAHGREQFANETAADLEANIDLYDVTGARLFSTGPLCAKALLEAPVKVNGEIVGMVKLCMQQPPSGHWRALVLLALGLGAVWKVSGRVARRLARPLDELADIVRRIGEGDLSARADLSCAQPDEIGLVAEAVNDMAARIEKQMKDQLELLATVSHELRTPLSRLRIITEIARDSGVSPKTFDELDREVVEMDSLVGELLASSRLEFGQLSTRSLSVRDVANRAAERASLPESSVIVQGDTDTVLADPTLLQRALANLFDNAQKHGQGADALEVFVKHDEVTFEVLDRGAGIGADSESLFLKFNRGQDGEGAHGLGLGLALVKRIAQAHGGRVWATNREGGGARVGFSVTSARG